MGRLKRRITTAIDSRIAKAVAEVEADIAEVRSDVAAQGKSIAEVGGRIRDMQERVLSNQELHLETAARIKEVEHINEHALDIMNNAHERDSEFLDGLEDEALTAPLSDEEEREIADFWRPYAFAYENDPRIQRACTRLSGRFDPSYFGYGLQRFWMVRFWFNKTCSNVLLKYDLPRTFPQVKHPVSLVSKAQGAYLDKEHRLITKKQAVEVIAAALKEQGELIIKPAGFEAGEGRGIEFLDESAVGGLEELFDTFGPDFVVQEIMRNHPSFAEPSPASLQTLRVVTFSYKEEIHFVGAIFRMAKAGRLDNFTQGGLACNVDRSGALSDFAIDHAGNRVEVHPSGYVFAGKTLFRGSECIDKALELHATIPQERVVAWDMTVDDAGDIVLVEYNSPGGNEALQAVGNNIYLNRDVAKEIFDEYLITRFFYIRATFDWNYREFADHVSLLKYCGLEDEVEVPRTIQGKRVLMLYNEAFRDSDAKTVRIPGSVRVDIESLSAAAPHVTFVREG